MLEEFKEFALRGSVVDMAVGIIVGTAFGKIVSSLVNEVVMPPFGLLLGKVDFSNLFINLSGQHFPSLAVAKVAGVATVNYGMFLNTVLDFIIVALAMFCICSTDQSAEAPAGGGGSHVSDQRVRIGFSTIPIKATCCPHCTSALKVA